MKLQRKIIATVLIFGILIGISYLLYKELYKGLGDKQPQILVVFKTADNSVEFWQSVRSGIDQAVKEFDVSLEIKSSRSESDISGQIQILENAIKAKPDAIVLAAADYEALVPVVKKIKEAGITLITIDSGLNSNLPESQIATDNIQAGRKLGQALSEMAAPGDRIAIITPVKPAIAIEREEGIKQGLSGNLGYRIDDTYVVGPSLEKACEITREILTKNPDIGGIAGLNDMATLGAAKVIKEMQLNGKVKLVGFDCSLDEIKLIQEGVIQATIVQKPFNMGYLGIKTAVQALKGKKFDKKIDTGYQIITKENMFSFENQKLLFPFVKK